MRETRSIIQVKVWKLILNDMRSNTEARTLVAFSDDRDKLLEWYGQQIADEKYVDIGGHYFPSKGDFGSIADDNYKYHKTFKPGSPLEWFNPLLNLDEPSNYGHGIFWEWTTDDEINAASAHIYRVP